MNNGSTDFSGRFDSGARVFIAGQGSVVELVSRQEVHVCLIVERICDRWSAAQLQGMVLTIGGAEGGEDRLMLHLGLVPDEALGD